MSSRFWFVMVVVLAMASFERAYAEVKLGPGETLRQDPEDKDFKNPVTWKGVEMVIVELAGSPEGTIRGELRSNIGGKSTTIAKWQVATTAPSWAVVKIRNGKAALMFGTQMNLKTKDNGSDNFIELVWKNGAIKAGRTWSGDRLGKRPAWATAIDPAV
jgi:hypothetical protein